MPNLDPVHDHAGSAAISSEGHIPGAADPSYTIDEDDRIGALIEAHSELIASVLRTLGHLTTAVDGMSRAVESLAARLDPLASTVNELADSAGLAPVDVPDERNCAQKMADGDFGEAAFAMYKIIGHNLGGRWGTDVDTSASKVTIRSSTALCTMHRSGKATTGGSDHNLRDDLRAILRAEGFDVQC